MSPSGRWLAGAVLSIVGLVLAIPLVTLVQAIFGLAGIHDDGPALLVTVALYALGVVGLAGRLGLRRRWRCPVWPTDR